MSRAVERGSVLLGIALLLITFSCVRATKEISTEPQELEPQEIEHVRTDVQSVISSARRNVAIKDYQKALEILNSTYAKNHKNGDLRSGYIRIIEEIKSDAESAFKNNRVAEAGSIYNILLRDSFQTADFADSVSFDREFLINRIKTCARGLTQEGLLKYREGKLDDAIAIWKKVLAFDRDNLEVKNSISTAQNQLKNLNNIR